MHVLDVNEIFWLTFYTCDRILEIWWNYWADALTLYYKYIKQSRIQQTNQTKTLNIFLKNWLNWWDKRLKNAKEVLKKLWLIDDIIVRDELWKIVGHYVRVNYLINEQKVRSVGITYNLSTTYSEQGVAETTSGWMDTNALSNININAWNTKKENNTEFENSEFFENNNSLSINNLDLQEKEKSCAKKEKEWWNQNINELINSIKQECNELWVAYNKDMERQFAKHILTAKEYWEFCEKIWQTRTEFALNVLKVSVAIWYFRWALSWPKAIYKNYAELYNQAKQKSQKFQNASVDVL
jgi:hypothetical protein